MKQRGMGLVLLVGMLSAWSFVSAETRDAGALDGLDETNVTRQVMRREVLTGEEAKTLYRTIAKRAEMLAQYRQDKLLTYMQEFKHLSPDTGDEVYVTVSKARQARKWAKGERRRFEIQDTVDGQASTAIWHPGVSYEYQPAHDRYVAHTSLKSPEPTQYSVFELTEIPPLDAGTEVTFLGPDVMTGQLSAVFQLRFAESPGVTVKEWRWVHSGLPLRTEVVTAAPEEGIRVTTVEETVGLTLDGIPDTLFDVPQDKVVEPLPSREESMSTP